MTSKGQGAPVPLKMDFLIKNDILWAAGGSMEEFKKIVVQKGNRSGILWGMLHRAKEEDYAAVQSDINLICGNGGIVITEGVFRSSYASLSKNGRRLRHLMSGQLANEIHARIAEAHNQIDEKTAITFPLRPICADLSVEEIADRCDKEGIRFPLLEYLFFFAWRDRHSRSRVSKCMNFLFKGSGAKIFGAGAKFFLVRAMGIRATAISLSLPWRNEAAAKVIDESDPTKNFILLYGSGHFDDIVKLLQGMGWVIRGA